MAITSPATNITLLKCPLENDGENTLTFTNATTQFNYFNGLPKRILDDTECTYQRKDSVIRFNGIIDELYQYNYVMYKNSAFSDKWFYAFIDRLEYVNDSTTFIYITTDLFQTWQFDLTYKPSFIEREHVNDDGIGKNTIEENLYLGEFVQNYSDTISPDKQVHALGGHTLNTYYMICFQVTQYPSGVAGVENIGRRYNGIFSGLKFIAVENVNDANKLIRKYDEGQADAIIAIFLAPVEFFDGAFRITVPISSSENIFVYAPADANYATALRDEDYTLSIPTKVDGYTPKNNKLFTYPFSYIMLDNNAGTCITQRYELFKNNTPSYYMAGTIGQGCSIRLTPVYYKNSQAENYEEGISALKLPICAWSSDYYLNWMTQNAINIPLTVAGTLIGAGASIAGGVATGGLGMAVGASTLLSASQQIGQLVSSIYQAQLTPNQAEGNANCSDIAFSWRRFFTVKQMSVRSEIAKICDDYFSAYGYKVNRVKMPNITGRRNWNYVKTVGANIQGNIPQADIIKLKAMLDSGITFWHNPSTYLNYSSNNDII